MIITYRQFTKLKFPVFILPSSNWEFVDGLLFVDGLVVDDRNMGGDSLGMRRLQTPYRNILTLKQAANNSIELIKSYERFFIDSRGKPFIYERTFWTSLRYHRISKVDRKVTASVLYLKGVNAPFTVPRPPPADVSWAGVLYYNGYPWRLYEYSREKRKDTRRKI